MTLMPHVWHVPLQLSGYRFVLLLAVRGRLEPYLLDDASSYVRDITCSPNTRLNVENAPSATHLMLSARV